MSRAARDKLAILAGQVSTAGLQLAIFALLGKGFGATALASYSLALATTTPVFLILGLSLRIIYVTAVEDWSRQWYFCVSLGVAAVCGLSAGAAGAAVGADRWLLAFIVVTKALDLIASAGIGVLQRSGSLQRGGIALVINGVVTLSVAAAAVSVLPSPLSVLAASTLGSLVSCFYAWMGTAAAKGTDRSPMAVLLARGFPIGAGTAIVSAAVNLPVLVLSRSASVNEVAAFAVLANLRTVVNVFFGATAQYGLSQMTQGARSSSARTTRAAVGRAIGGATAMAVVAAATFALLGPHILPLIFGIEVQSWVQPVAATACAFVAVAIIYMADAALSTLQSYWAQVVSAAATMATIAAVLATAPTTLNTALWALAAGLGVGALAKLVLVTKALGRGADGVR